MALTEKEAAIADQGIEVGGAVIGGILSIYLSPALGGLIGKGLVSGGKLAISIDQINKRPVLKRKDSSLGGYDWETGIPHKKPAATKNPFAQKENTYTSPARGGVARRTPGETKVPQVPAVSKKPVSKSGTQRDDDRSIISFEDRRPEIDIGDTSFADASFADKDAQAIDFPSDTKDDAGYDGSVENEFDNRMFDNDYAVIESNESNNNAPDFSAFDTDASNSESNEPD